MPEPRMFRAALRSLSILRPHSGLTGSYVRERVRGEVTNADKHERIVRAVAEGCTSLKAISETTGMAASQCSDYIRTLIELEILDTYTPMAGAPRKPRYRVRDGMADLWYAVFSNRPHFFAPDDASRRYEMVRDRIGSVLGRRFGRFCAYYLTHHYRCLDIGSWWGTEEDAEGNRTGIDIDIVARVTYGNNQFMVFAECEFRDRPAGASDLTALASRARRLSETPKLMIFSAGGFEEGLIEDAEREGAVLIGPDELMGRRPAPGLS